jgi:hypothetical protein
MNDPERNALLAENERLRSALRELREAISDENGRNLLSIVDTVWVSDIETAIDCIDAALNNPEDVPADRLLAPAAGTPPLLAAERSTKPAAKLQARDVIVSARGDEPLVHSHRVRPGRLSGPGNRPATPNA